MPDDERPKNPFVRWKQHVDCHIGLTLNSVLGIPSIISPNFYLRQPREQKSTTETTASQHHMSRQRDGLSSPPHDEYDDLLKSEFQLLQFEDWFHNSPYSPANLQRLPQPIPRGVPDGIPPESFTFHDAFDDLLLSSTGRPLRDIKLRALLNTDRVLTSGVPQPNWSEWAGRVGGTRLLEGYFTHLSWRQYQEQVRQDQADEWIKYIEDESYGDNDWKREAAKAYRRTEEGVVPASRAQTSGGLFDELERAFKAAGLIHEDNSDSDTSNHQRVKDSAPQRVYTEADTEDQLYSAIKSAFAETERSLGAFIKSIADVRVGGEATASFSKSKTDDLKTDASEKGEEVRTVRTTEEHVDWFGSKHIKTVIRTLNANGDEIARETHYTIRGGSQSRHGGEENDSEEEDRPRESSKQHDKQAEAEEGGKSTGWFWK